MENFPKQNENQIEDGVPSFERALERVRKFYEKLGPRLGSYLVHPNVVLTLAGARGQTEFFIDNPTSEDIEQHKKLRQETTGGDVIFTPSAVQENKKPPYLGVSVDVRDGYIATFRNSHLADLAPPPPDADWKSVIKWHQDTKESLYEKQKRGEIPVNMELDHVLIGIEKGYPDVAVMSAMGAYSIEDEVQRKKKVDKLLSTDISHAQEYSCAEPDFDYGEEYKDHPDIVKTEKEWGEILSKFYDSEWHKSLAQDPDFTQAVKEQGEK
jgi:hypothetical protein